MVLMNKNLFKDEKGAALVIVALACTVIFGFAALAIDVGRISAEKASLQSAVDAASLAAVHSLPDNTGEAGYYADLYMDNNGFKPLGYAGASSAKEQLTYYNKEYLNSNKKIRITASVPLDYTFAKIFNIGGIATVTKTAAAEVTTPVDDLDYALFSGSTLDWLQFTGNDITIVGDVHCNQDLKGKALVDGTITYVGEILTALSGLIADEYIQTPVKNMPTLSTAELLRLKNVADSATPKTYYNGDKSFSADELNAAFDTCPVIYVDGNVTTNGTGVMAERGTIIATGDITFNGSEVITTLTSDICFYSIGGNITLNGQGAELYGAIWAPTGIVTFNGSNQTITGKVYGNEVDINGNGTTIIWPSSDLNEAFKKTYKLVE
jgi:Flp pilus assembly protein TadG